MEVQNPYTDAKDNKKLIEVIRVIVGHTWTVYERLMTVTLE